MPDLLLYFSTAACWLLLSAVAWRASRPALAGVALARGDMRLENVVVPVALVLHGMLLYRRVVVPDGLDLGVANAVSMLVWLTVLIYWLAGLAFPGLPALLALMSPGGLLAGRSFRGWRGRKAVHWTLAGFTALLLAYVGSKVVLELILKSG